MEHVGIVVNDLAAATAFFVELGLTLQGEAMCVVREEIGRREPAEGEGGVELAKFQAPSGPGGDGYAPANTPGIRHLSFSVDDIDAVVAGLRARSEELVGGGERYKDIYRLCYVRGPEGIIVELAERLG